MTHKHLTALAVLAVLAACVLAPLNAARAEEGEKSPSPPKSENEKVPAPPATAEGPKAPQDPKIAALVKEMEDPADHEKRAKAFDALLALGDPGVAAVRESLSCRGAKVVIESTVTPPAAPPNTPIKVEFRLRNAGTGTIWIMAVRKDPYLLRFQNFGRFESMGCTRPRNNAPLEFVGIDFTRKDLPDIHPLTFWRPARPGETIGRVETNTKIPRVGRLEFIVHSAIDLPHKPRDAAYLLSPEFEKSDLYVGSGVKEDDVQDRQTVNAFALPELEQLPAEGPVTLEVSAKLENLPGEAAHFPCSVTFRNTKPDTPLLFEDSMCAFAWVALLDERSTPAGYWSFKGCLPGTANEKFALQPRVLKEPVTLNLQIPRPTKPGTYRILAGYEVTPGGTKPGDDWAPTFTDLPKKLAGYGRIVQARVFALSKPIHLPETAPKSGAPNSDGPRPAAPTP